MIYDSRIEHVDSLDRSSVTMDSLLPKLKKLNPYLIHIADSIVYCDLPELAPVAALKCDLLDNYTGKKNGMLFVVSHLQLTFDEYDKCRVYIEGDWQDGN